MQRNKMLHVVYRVGDLDKSIDFYTNVLGMKVLRKRDVPEGKYTNVFLGYGPESKGEHFSVELTYNYGVDKYDIGKLGFLGLGVCLPELQAVESSVEGHHGRVIRNVEELEITPSMIPDEPAEQYRLWTMATAEDPDGYQIELLQKPQRDPMHRVRLHVTRLEPGIAFYTEVLGMKLLRKRSLLPEWPAISVWLGYGDDEFDQTLLELIYEFSTQELDVGDGYGQIAISTPDVYEAAKIIEAKGGEISRAPGPVPGIGTKIVAAKDPDGYKVVLVDEKDFEAEFNE
ncbi:unnamed protein product [Vitrella brassicaformis CCMP3155]|uniref:VOC domain-containing protein n=1 Tax=Vitrella brassicaformis (strain CCMP3155) TaxID=1169540 RepID=A0A0G4G8C0_VITBC|nr:unnamed protein product [Vitrella brassicaformis CCMP3155]|eukprot:CEM25132.1 unnamed protein product [Vitrella brassicaformis CCMP3155]